MEVAGAKRLTTINTWKKFLHDFYKNISPVLHACQELLPHHTNTGIYYIKLLKVNGFSKKKFEQTLENFWLKYFLDNSCVVKIDCVQRVVTEFISEL